MIRPQINQQKNHSTMINNLKKGDKVVTQGGIIGNITNFKGKDNEIVVLDVNNNKIDIHNNNYNPNRLLLDIYARPEQSFQKYF